MRQSMIIASLCSQVLFFIGLPLFWQLFAFLHPIVIVVIWLCLTALTFFITFLWRGERIILPSWLGISLFVVYTIGLLVLLFSRPGGQEYTYNLLPFATIGFYFTGEVPALVAFYNLAANIALFIPFGLFLCSYSSSLWLKMILPIISIIGIESIQFVTHRGSLDIDDLILNVWGVWLGYALYPLFVRVVQPKGKKDQHKVHVS